MRAGEGDAACDGNRIIRLLVDKTQLILRIDIDPVIKITDRVLDMEFTDTNFGVFLTETYAHDEVYILNAQNRPIYAFGDSKTLSAEAFEGRRPVLNALMAEIRQGDRSRLRARPDMLNESKGGYRVLTGVHVARWAGHIISVDGRPAVVAGMTIVPNIDPTLLKGTPNLLLSITYIDDAFISDVGHSLLFPDLALKPQAAKGPGVVSQAFVGDDGISAGFLSWTTRRPGHLLLTIILPLVAAGVIATGFLSKTMFKRLKRASEALEKIESFLQSYLARRSGQRALAAYVDIDRFKDINDTLGHEAGDQLIKMVSQRLSERLRVHDFLSRFGGDEFAILCVPSGPEGGGALAERIAQAFASPFIIKGQRIKVTASVGLAVAPDHGATADELMRHADIALYEAKSRGRDRAVFFCTEMAEQVEHRRSIELDLSIALEKEELSLHYQPLISCRTGTVTGVEALCVGATLNMARCLRPTSFPSRRTRACFPCSANGCSIARCAMPSAGRTYKSR
jgi:diguanylate cyclase (GGDEF)-like protein